MDLGFSRGDWLGVRVIGFDEGTDVSQQSFAGLGVSLT
jgi:hypothetical protein